MYFLVFHGKERFDQIPAHEHDASEEPDPHHHQDEHHAPHESPWVVTVPLVALAIPSVLAGYLFIGPMLYGDFFKDAILVNLEKHPALEEMAKEFHGPLAMALHGLTSPVFWLAAAGVALAYYLYMVNTALPARIQTMVSPLYRLLDNKYYMDWFNENVLARGARGLGIGLWKGGDQAVIDGAMVNGSAHVVGWFAGVTRRLQSGYIYHYALAMIVGVFVLMTWFVWLNH
jgi:NADH-quinone oxidoreductase subunit L